MKSKILMFLLVLSFMLAGATSSALATVVDEYLWGGGPPSYTDAEKGPGPGDNNLCWAAAASNVLAWTGWDGGVGDEDAIFANFQPPTWSNLGSWQKWGWEWWFTGTVSDPLYSDPQTASWSKYTGGSAHYTKAEYDANVLAWDQTTLGQDLSNADDKVKDFIDDGYGTTLSLARYDQSENEIYGHAISLWGYNWDDDTGIINGVWVSDPDDDESNSSPPNTLDYYALTYDIFDQNQWYLDGYTSYSWWINGISGLLSYEGNGEEPPPPPVPEPATILLLGSGLLGLFGVGRKKFKRG